MRGLCLLVLLAGCPPAEPVGHDPSDPHVDGFDPPTFTCDPAAAPVAVAAPELVLSTRLVQTAGGAVRVRPLTNLLCIQAVPPNSDATKFRNLPLASSGVSHTRLTKQLLEAGEDVPVQQVPLDFCYPPAVRHRRFIV